MFLNADSEDGGADDGLVYIRKSDMRRAGSFVWPGRGEPARSAGCCVRCPPAEGLSERAR